MKDTDNRKKELKGVVCDVCHCVHHGENNSCHASEIAVGTHNACATSETMCATFKPKHDPVSEITEG